MLYSYINTIYGDTKKISQTVLDIIYEIKNFVDSDTLFDIRLILNELLLNCHKHGNKEDCSKSINLNLEIFDSKVIIEVEDEGKEDWKRPEYNCKDMKASGRGLLLVEKLSDDLKIDRNKIRCKLETPNY